MPLEQEMRRHPAILEGLALALLLGDGQVEGWLQPVLDGFGNDTVDHVFRKHGMSFYEPKLARQKQAARGGEV